MNIYFLVEGKRTERKVYPKWLSFLLPELIKVESYDGVSNNNYYLFSGEGYPSILEHLKNSVDDINNLGKYDYLVVCLDSDDDTIEVRIQEVQDYLSNNAIKLNNTKLEIIVQNRCFETWFLGNRRIFKDNPQSTCLCSYIQHYNVKNLDPELMVKPSNFDQSTSIFHSSYLKEILSERNISYSKKNPKGVTEKYFLDELIKRSQDTKHISSFQYFIDFCEKIKNLL